MIDLKLLIKSGVHFGHQKSKRNPKMDPYIWGYKNNVNLIDVSKTAYQLERAARFLESVAAENKTILWVGTKKPAQETILHIARELNQPYVVYRWVGGTFSNNRQVRKAVANLLHYNDILEKSEQFPYNKKELSTFQKRVDRLNRIVGGIRSLTWPVGAVIVVDVKKEHVAVKEALSMGIPIVALVDTNSDPSSVDYVIPANDDVPRSINVLLSYLADAVHRGQQIAASTPQDGDAAVTFDMSSDKVSGLDEDEEEDESGKKRSRSGAASRGTKKPVGARPRTQRKPVTAQNLPEDEPGELGEHKEKEAPAKRQKLADTPDSTQERTQESTPEKSATVVEATVNQESA